MVIFLDIKFSDHDYNIEPMYLSLACMPQNNHETAYLNVKTISNIKQAARYAELNGAIIKRKL